MQYICARFEFDEECGTDQFRKMRARKLPECNKQVVVNIGGGHFASKVTAPHEINPYQNRHTYEQ